LNVSPRFNPEAFFNLSDLTMIFLSSFPPFSLFNSNLPISKDLESPTLYSRTEFVPEILKPILATL
jgi:hypothetical protein